MGIVIYEKGRLIMRRNYVVLCLTPDECETLGNLIKDYIEINNFIIENHYEENTAYDLHKQNVILERLIKRFE